MVLVMTLSLESDARDSELDDRFMQASSS